jgi:geranylgeranyl diphosphate synthase type II
MSEQVFQTRYETYRTAVESYLETLFAGRPDWRDLYERYSLLAGGKRIRPVLTLEFARLAGLADWKTALPMACALELVHTYSLIHDDLPCMDDDDLRRGRPTNHKVFGEANAVLAGDGLLTAAFETMLAPGQKLPPERVLEAAGILARAAGGRGMVGGQVLDMAGEGRALGLTEVEELQRLKTGALIRAAVEMGCAVAGGAEEQREALCRYADCLGLAFQIQDDILDVVGDEATLGKPIGSDVRSDKTTFVALKGLADCRILVAELTDRAVEALAPFGSEAESLRGLAQSLAGREK